MARTVSRRGGGGGYIKGFLAGIVLVVLVLAAFSLTAPVGEPDLTTAADGEPGLAEPGNEAEGGVEVGETIEAELEEDEQAAVEVEGLAEEGVIDLTVEEGLDDVEPALGETADEDAIRPVELADLPGELPAGEEAALAPGGADEIPRELDEVLEGVAAADEPEAEVDIEGVIEADEAAGGELASAMPPPLPDPRPVALDGPALDVNAAPFTAPEDEPVVAVVMDGVAGSELSPDVLFALPLPVTLGIVPGREGDEALAEAARARNWEVLAQLPVVGEGGEPLPGALAEGMAPEEVAERTEALMGRLRQAVAAASEGTLEDPEAVAALTGALAAHGFGYVGAGAAAGEDPPSAQPSAAVPAGASAEEVIAVLDEAVEDAGPGGAALVVLPPTRAAAEALARWNAEGGAGRVAPLSAVLRRQAGG